MLSVRFALAALRNAALDVACVPGIGILQFQVGDRRDVLLDRRQRTEAGRKFIKRVLAGRRPARDVAAHRHVDKTQTTELRRTGRRVGQGGHRGNHRIEQRQRQCGSRTLAGTFVAAELSW